MYITSNRLLLEQVRRQLTIEQSQRQFWQTMSCGQSGPQTAGPASGARMWLGMSVQCCTVDAMNVQSAPGGVVADPQTKHTSSGYASVGCYRPHLPSSIFTIRPRRSNS